MFNQENDRETCSLSPKRSNVDLLDGPEKAPFKLDAQQYIGKVLNLMTIINEIDDLAKVDDLKTKNQLLKNQMVKIKMERDEHI